MLRQKPEHMHKNLKVFTSQQTVTMSKKPIEEWNNWIK